MTIIDLEQVHANDNYCHCGDACMKYERREAPVAAAENYFQTEATDLTKGPNTFVYSAEPTHVVH